MADETTNEGTTATATETQTATNPDLDAARAELAAEKSRGLAAKNQYAHFQTQYQQQIRDLQSQGFNGGGYQQPEEVAPEAAEMRRLRDQGARQSEELGLMGYKIDNPNWQDSWAEVQELINDPVRAAEVAVYDQNGNADFKRSLNNARREIELAEFRQAKEATAEAKAGQVTEQDRQKGQATISGVSASVGEEEVDVSSMTSDEMLKAGLVDMDPRDPVRPRHSE